MEALIIVNWKYPSSEYNDLDNPEKDGELMEKLLREGGYQHIKLLQNEEDIEKVVKDIIENEKQENSIDRFHFHFSGRTIKYKEI
jgi:hypothetical protein